jgi:hypothetical protein
MKPAFVVLTAMFALFSLVGDVLADASANEVVEAFVRSQRLKQGDAQSLHTAEKEYTAAGLSELKQKMIGFIDDQGAPAFSQDFIPEGDAVTTSQEGDAVKVRVSGVLKQVHDIAVTVYPASFEIKAVGSPPKIIGFSMLSKAHKH